MTAQEPSQETKIKILLDEANLTFCETAQRKDKSGERTRDGSGLDETNMAGEFDEEDYNKILDLQLEAARICDEHPELEQKTADMFQSVSSDNAGELFRQVEDDKIILNLARIAVTIFLLRFPTVQSYVNKGHPLVLAMDEYMLENANQQNWHDYKFIARDFGWV